MGIVWGTPLVLILSAIGWFGWALQPLYTFWIGLFLCVAIAVVSGDRVYLATGLKVLLVMAILVLLFLHVALFGLDAVGPAARLINGLLVVSVLLVSLRVWVELRWIIRDASTTLPLRSSGQAADS